MFWNLVGPVRLVARRWTWALRNDPGEKGGNHLIASLEETVPETLID